MKTFSMEPEDDGWFIVQVTYESGTVSPRMFRTEAKAVAWIVEQRRSEAASLMTDLLRQK